MSKIKRKRISAALTDEQKAALKRESIRTDLSMSALIRLYIERMLLEEEYGAEKRVRVIDRKKY